MICSICKAFLPMEKHHDFCFYLPSWGDKPIWLQNSDGILYGLFYTDAVSIEEVWEMRVEVVRVAIETYPWHFHGLVPPVAWRLGGEIA